MDRCSNPGAPSRLDADLDGLIKPGPNSKWAGTDLTAGPKSPSQGGDRGFESRTGHPNLNSQDRPTRLFLSGSRSWVATGGNGWQPGRSVQCRYQAGHGPTAASGRGSLGRPPHATCCQQLPTRWLTATSGGPCLERPTVAQRAPGITGCLSTSTTALGTARLAAQTGGDAWAKPLHGHGRQWLRGSPDFCGDLLDEL
jgi:hypothetical protein